MARKKRKKRRSRPRSTEEASPRTASEAEEPLSTEEEPTIDGEPAGEGELRAADEPTLVEDLDATLDEDLDSPDGLRRLIAETAAGGDAPEEAAEPEAIVLDGDAVAGEPATIGVPGDEPIAEEADEAAAAGSVAEKARAVGAESPETVTVERGDRGRLPDLGAVSSPEVRDRLLAQALAHSETKDARYSVPFQDPRPTGRWKGLVASLLFIVAGTVAVAPPGWVRPEPPARLGVADRALYIREALLLQAQQVEAFRVRFQRLPDALDELPSRLEGIRFVKSGNRAYQLIAYEADGNAIVYDSSSPSRQFEALGEAWTASGGTS